MSSHRSLQGNSGHVVCELHQTRHPGLPMDQPSLVPKAGKVGLRVRPIATPVRVHCLVFPSCLWVQVLVSEVCRPPSLLASGTFYRPRVFGVSARFGGGYESRLLVTAAVRRDVAIFCLKVILCIGHVLWIPNVVRRLCVNEQHVSDLSSPAQSPASCRCGRSNASRSSR